MIQATRHSPRAPQIAFGWRLPWQCSDAIGRPCASLLEVLAPKVDSVAGQSSFCRFAANPKSDCAIQISGSRLGPQRWRKMFGPPIHKTWNLGGPGTLGSHVERVTWGENGVFVYWGCFLSQGWFSQGWQHPQHHQHHLDLGLPIILGGSWEFLGGRFRRLLAGLDLHEGGSWGGLGWV